MTPEELNKQSVVANKAHPETQVTRPKRRARIDASKTITSIAEDEECF